MDKIVEHILEVFPDGDGLFNLLIFLLLVFGSMYVIFKLIFYIGDNAGKRKEDKAKKEEAKKKATASKCASEKQPPTREPIIVYKGKNSSDELEFLEEEKIEVKSDPKYSNTHSDSYVFGRSVGPSYSYGDNFLYDYYNNGKTVDYTEVEVDKSVSKTSIPDIGPEEKSEEIIKAYNDMPTQLKQYILDKITTNRL